MTVPCNDTCSGLILPKPGPKIITKEFEFMTSAFIHETAEIDELVEIGSDTKFYYLS